MNSSEPTYQQLKAERDKLDRENEQLHEKNGDLGLDIQKLQEELEQARAENQSQPSTSETALPDLYEIRDRVLKRWRLAKRSESKERLYEFANILIEEIAKADPSYTFIDRLLSDLDQARKSDAATSEAMRYWNQRYETAVKKAKYKGVVIE